MEIFDGTVLAGRRHPPIWTAVLLSGIVLMAGDARSQIVDAAPGRGAIETESVRAATVAPLYAAADPLELTVALDFDAVLDDRAEEPEERPGMLMYTTDGGAEVALDLKVRTRGFYRLHLLECDVPPLRLNLKKKQVAGTVFDGQDKLKLVTHCRNDSESFQQYLFQEYLIYKAYNLLTDLSFHARLVDITYVDSRGRHDPVSRYGFLIEDEDRMAARNGAKLIESGATIHPEATHREMMTLLSVFQYMIGNTDWTVTTRHNIKLILVDSSGAIVAVPYDFDWAGLVDPPYATPDPQLNLRDVRERKFMGFCRSEEEFQAAFARFIDRKEDMLELFADFSLLDAKRADRSIEYVEEFYEIIREPKRVEREFLEECM